MKRYEARRLRLDLHSRLNSKGDRTLFVVASKLQQRMLDRALAECTGQTTCVYPDWLERRMLAFNLWKGQFLSTRKELQGRWVGDHFEPPKKGRHAWAHQR